MLVPMYNAELAPPGIRGSLVALQQLAITCKHRLSETIGVFAEFVAVGWCQTFSIASSSFLAVFVARALKRRYARNFGRVLDSLWHQLHWRNALPRAIELCLACTSGNPARSSLHPLYRCSLASILASLAHAQG